MIEQGAGFMILIPLYRFLVLGKASHIFSRKNSFVEITFSLFHHDVSIEPCVSIWEVFVQAACWEWSTWLVWSMFSKFRIVPVTQFLQHFASDRSHMVCFSTRRLLRWLNYLKLVKTPGPPTYLSSPPLYKPICGPLAAEGGVVNNLMSHFVCMSSDGYYGSVLDRTEIEEWH